MGPKKQELTRIRFVETLDFFKKKRWRIAPEILEQREVFKTLPEEYRARVRETKEENGVCANVVHFGGLSTPTILAKWEERTYRPAHPAEFLGTLIKYAGNLLVPIATLYCETEEAIFMGANGRRAALAFTWEKINEKAVPCLFLTEFEKFKWEEEWTFLEMKD